MLFSVSFIVGNNPLPALLLMPPTTARVQEKDAPAVALVAVYEKALPLHKAALKALLNCGVGLTGTTTLNVDGLVHPLAVKV
jgi:hypothetical protein